MRKYKTRLFWGGGGKKIGHGCWFENKHAYLRFADVLMWMGSYGFRRSRGKKLKALCECLFGNLRVL